MFSFDLPIIIACAVLIVVYCIFSYISFRKRVEKYKKQYEEEERRRRELGLESPDRYR